ncbi:MAG: aromatic ring-hydroxylating dioxygenase subunit alpha [Caldimonas sp.]
MRERFRHDPDAIRALVEPDRVHRDLYIDEELYALEQERFFANTWSYVGHESQLKNAGDYLTVEIAGQPLVAVRHDDGSVRVLMNRCAHKGARVVSAPAGNTGRFFRCPYHAWAYKTDGALLAIPLKKGYEGTGLAACEAAKGLAPVRHMRSHRGFVFAKLGDGGLGFDEYFGGSLGSIDNLADRSPEGELEITGGCLRFLQQCNWKMFVENLNDTMHPMVVHESSAGTAKAMWKDEPADKPKPMAIEQFVPFVSDYKFFEDMGVRVFANGHSYSGVNFSIHSGYAGVAGYEEAMQRAYGADRSAAIMKVARHNTVYYPSLTIKGAIQSIRVVRPIAVDKTVIESWTFRLKGAPEALLARTVTYNRLINSPFSVVGHDDLHSYRAIQKGLHAGGNPWVSLHRDFDPAEIGAGDVVATGTSEVSMRNQYRAWLRFMTETAGEAS